MPGSGANQMPGERIMVIRPLRDDDAFIALLNQSGAQVTQIPVIDIEPLEEEQAIKNLILDFDNMDIAIFVSGNAARFGLQWLDQYWPMLPLGVQYLAVGRKTAEILQQHIGREDAGDVDFPAEQQNSEGLLALPQMQSVTGKRIVIFRGRQGRELLGQTLTARGANVTYCELYKRIINTENVAKAHQQLKQTDILVVHSGDLLKALGEVPDSQAAIVKVIVPSNRVADIARQLGYSNIHIAASALPEAMYSSVKCLVN